MTTAKGRNGYFKLDRAEATTFPPTGDKPWSGWANLSTVLIEIRSSRNGKNAPITLLGGRDEVRSLFLTLLDQIKDEEERELMGTSSGTRGAIHAQR